MMRPIISAVAVAAVIAAGTFLLRAPFAPIELSAAAMLPLQELHAIAGVNKLPVQEIEDQSLIFPTAAKR
jgi:hypothetical protein